MAGEIKRFNWMPRPTRWQHAEAWRAHRSNMVRRFLDDSAATSAAFVNAQNNFSVGMATLAAQASAQRVQNQLSAARNQFSTAASSINRLV